MHRTAEILTMARSRLSELAQATGPARLHMNSPLLGFRNQMEILYPSFYYFLILSFFSAI